ncbi:hypothetical protein [Arthrobacter sp. AQ5-05]|uniref:hypothetical protein n=1 Tax=Arthrobacter sp. AQ5-05 TaxID=2184581 RepID=UPI0012B61D3C|nr:hypothetical protein [Arthrobacter sp. AQ5-05]
MSKRPSPTGGAHAAPSRDPKHKPGYKRTKGYYKSEVEREAFRQGMSVEEYGVYKGSVGSAVKPVNSAGGLLAISLILSCLVAGALVAFTIHWIQSGPAEALKNTVPLLLAGMFVPWSWVYYARERKAERLRKERGITLIRPE